MTQIFTSILTKRKIALYLGIIIIISLVFKFYFLDFSVPVISERFTYTLDAIALSNGDFAVPPRQNPGWSLFISPFFLLLDSDNFLDYSNIVVSLGAALTTITIIPMYILARKFFGEKYSLVAASLFAFEPHLNRWSSLGFTEPLNILVLIGSFYFILSKDSKYAYLSFLLAGLVFWTRISGLIIIIALTIIFFVNFRHSPNLFGKYLICITIFFLVISPVLIQRYIQYEDPFYYETAQNIFHDQDYLSYGYLGSDSEQATAIRYIQEKGIPQFIHKFVLNGTYNVLQGIIKISVPYLIVLLPFGLVFSLRAFDQNNKYIRANWIIILVTTASFAIPFAVVPEKRFLFPLLPFLILFCVIPIQRLIEYGLSTFSFSKKQKNIFLFSIIVLVLILSIGFSMRYEKLDGELVQEKMEISRILENNFNGTIATGDNTLEYHVHVTHENPPGIFKTYKINREKIAYQGPLYEMGNVKIIGLSGKSVDELIRLGEQNDLTYLAVKNEMPTRKFLEDVYQNEEKYPYLIKVLDSSDKDFKKLKVKVFKIDYEKFHEYENTQTLPNPP